MVVQSGIIYRQSLRFDLPAEPQAILTACLYFVLGILDMTLSIAAYASGAVESNPFMAFLVHLGMFVPGKAILTTFISALMLFVHSPSRRWQFAVWGGIGLMTIVVLYQSCALAVLSSSH